MNRITFDKLNDANKRTRRADNRDTIDYLIDAARVNADDMLQGGACAPWDRMFVDSLGAMLCTGEYDRHVYDFFTKHGVRW